MLFLDFCKINYMSYNIKINITLKIEVPDGTPSGTSIFVRDTFAA